MATYNSLIEGLEILAKYDPEGKDGHINGADHDILFGGEAEKITEEDYKRLEQLGWYYDSTIPVWSRPV